MQRSFWLKGPQIVVASLSYPRLEHNFKTTTQASILDLLLARSARSRAHEGRRTGIESTITVLRMYLNNTHLCAPDVQKYSFIIHHNK